ncbi:MAG: hypothetical protein LC676_14405, partial [Loktanella sp.]|nr:hypothetical protein [Loktanella sp.]
MCLHDPPHPPWSRTHTLRPARRAQARPPQAVLDDDLKRLVSSELLYCRGIAPELIFEFKHALIKDAAYQGLLRSKRLDRQCDCDLAWSHLTRGKVLAARGNASQANAAYTL